MKLFFFTHFFFSKRYGGFLKWWYPTTMGFPTKNDHFGVWNGGYHHLRTHPYQNWKIDTRCNLIFSSRKRSAFFFRCLKSFFNSKVSRDDDSWENLIPSISQKFKKQITWEIKHLMLKYMVNFKDFPCLLVHEVWVGNITGWWFQICFIFTPIWGRFPFWLIFFNQRDDPCFQPTFFWRSPDFSRPGRRKASESCGRLRRCKCRPRRAVVVKRIKEMPHRIPEQFRFRKYINLPKWWWWWWWWWGGGGGGGASWVFLHGLWNFNREQKTTKKKKM